jgi:hypothetical protein
VGQLARRREGSGCARGLTISVEPPKLMPEDEKKLSDAYRAVQDAN